MTHFVFRATCSSPLLGETVMKFVHRPAATAGLLALAGACTPAAEEAAAPAAAVESLVSEPAAPAEQDLNASINIALNPTTGLPIFFGGSQGGMTCNNPPDCTQFSGYSIDGNGDVVLNSWPGKVNFIITISADGYVFNPDGRQAVMLGDGTNPPPPGSWDQEFTPPVVSADQKTLTFTDTNGANGVWEYSVVVTNSATGQTVTLDPSVRNNGVGTR
jgi:hypothetical protein